MQKRKRLFLIAIATTLLLSEFASGIFAQRNPTMTEQQRDADKESLFARYIEHKRIPQSDQQRLAYEAGKEYLRLFGTDLDPNVKEVRRFVTEYERVRRQYDIDNAYTSRNYARTFEIGRTLLKKQPEDFYVLGTLAEAGYENAVAGNASLNAETVGYAKKAIQLLDDGKVSKGDPFKTVEVARGFLNFALGNLLRDQSPVEAAAAFRKAVQADSPYKTDASAYHRMGIAILKGEFAQLSTEYNEKYGSKEASAEQTAMLQRVMQLAERAIDAYARAVALTGSPQQQEARTRIMEQLTALYKNFHNNSDAGLDELIATVLSKPLP
jgi:hypothetical protein